MRTAGAILVFVAVSVASAVALAFPLGGLSQALAWAAFAIGFASSILAWRGIRAQDQPTPSAWDVLMLTVFALASLRAFLWLLYPVGDEWRVLSPNNLGDLSKHIHIIRYLANGAHFWPESPFFPQVPLSYYFGTDLFNSLLLCVGFPLERSLVVIGLCGAALSAWALWRWGGGFALAFLLFNGGLAGFLIFQTGHVEDFQSDLAWKNFFLSMVVTQRALLYALPATLFLMAAWREDFFGKSSGLPEWIGWVLYSSMPIFCLQAFAFLSLLLAAMFFAIPGARIRLLQFVAASFLPASILVLLVTGMFTQDSGFHWHPGWMQGGDDWQLWLKGHGVSVPMSPVASSAIFWAENFGFSIPLLGYLAWDVLKKRDPETLVFAGTGLAVFAICCFFQFARWDWDNTKFFLWAWLACAPSIWNLISRWKPAVRGLVCFLLFFSGAVSLVGGLDGRHGYKLVCRSDLDRARALLAEVPPLDRLATEPTFDNPAILLGRPVVCGYEGMLWAHGLDYQDTLRRLNEVLAMRDPMTNAKAIHAKWIFQKERPLLKVE